MADQLSGAKLAESAYLIAKRRDAHHTGFEIAELVQLIERSGVRIAGDDPWQTLRSALNGDQHRWLNHDGMWVPIDEARPVGTEISGRALSDAIYPFVQAQYPSDHVFHYEVAKEALMKTGVRIKGRATGPTMRAALVGSPDRFEPYPARGRGWWRWKESK